MLHTIRALSLLLLIIINTPAFGQEISKDRLFLKKIYANQGDLDSIFYFSNKLEKSKDSCFVYEGHIHKSKYYYKKGEYRKSEKKIIKILKELKEKKSFCLIKIRIEALNRFFWIKKNQNLFKEAFDYLIKIENEIKNLPKTNNYHQTLKTTVTINKSLIKSLIGNHKESRDILKKHVYQDSPNHQIFSKKSNKSSILNLIGESYLKSSCCHFSIELDSASFYFRKAYDVAKTFKPLHKDSEALYDLREAKVFIAKKKYHRALQLLRKWDSRAKHLNIEKNVNYLKTISFYNIKNNDSTLYYGKKIGGSIEKSAEIFEIIANLYYDKKQLDSAAKYSKLTTKEIEFSAKSIGEIGEAIHLHEIQKIEQEKNKIVFENKKALNIVYVYFAFAMVLFMILINYLYRKNKIIKHNQIATEKKKDLTVQKKPYSINSKLEKKILEGLNELEKSDFYLEKSFNLNNLAKKLNTNTSYVSQTINKTKGKTFKQYYTSLRIEYLIKQFEEDKNYRKYTIEYIGQLIGYTNASAFTRAFKKHKGITPSEFIKKLEKSGK